MMMTNYTFKDILLDSEIMAVKELLKKNNLTYEPNVTMTVGLYHDENLIATGSVDKNVIKMIAVDKSYQSENLSSKIFSYLLFHLEKMKIDHYFLFTKPENKHVFSNYNLNKIIETDDVILYENSGQNIKINLNKLKTGLPAKGKSRGSIVMNLNPMTLGHLYLIEKALEICDDLIIFLVEEDSSVINYETRMKILKKTVSHLKNVHVLPSTPYMISNATFPTYFLKSQIQIHAYTTLDVSIFKKYFIPIFEIDLRFVGDEPLDIVTNYYNTAMKEMLDEKVYIIPRKIYNEQVISASLVRKLAKEKDYKTIKKLVPKASYKYLISKKGRASFNVA